ncbi:MAG: hypothetical protein KGN02_07765 [bacterium]|nr:hypothetical protein [bacterium]
METQGALRSFAAFIAMVAGVALCVRAHAPLVLPAAFLLVAIIVPRPKTSLQFVGCVCGFVATAIAVGILFVRLAGDNVETAVMLTGGLVLATLSRLRGPLGDPVHSDIANR